MTSPFRIESSEIERLSPEQLPRIMNQLLRAEAANLALPVKAVETSLRITVPDGGIDARVYNTSTSDRRLPLGESVWQFKAMEKLSAQEMRKEAMKPAVRSAMEKGATYCLALKGDTTPVEYARLEARLTGIINEQYPGAFCRLLTADAIADWASDHPVMALAFEHPVGEVVPLTMLPMRQGQHAIRFEPDAARTAIIEAVRQRFASEDGPIHLRVQGRPGVGKTRLALEIFRDYGEVVLYAPEPPSQTLLTWMAYRPTAHAILVVDECDWLEAMRLFQIAQLSERRVRLLTVGSAQTVADGPETYALPPVGEQTMERVVGDAAPVLSPDQVRWVVRVSRGFVKLAIVLAQQVAKGAASVTTLTSTQDVLGILEQLLPDRRHQRAMRGLALLTRVGWDSEVDVEGKIIADFIGMQWAEMRDAIAEVSAIGLVSKQGRYRYVSPEILALWLAAAQWRTRKEDLLGLLNNLPSAAARDAMTDRLASLAGLEEVAEVVATLLGPSGPFDKLASLNDERVSKLFSTLARAHPRAALHILQRLLDAASDADLEGLQVGRRYIVWTLERLARRTETFAGAGRLLLRLAQVETETFGNNATGVWVSLFLTHLGTTEVPAPARYPLIEEALTAPSLKTHELAVAAIGAALSTYEVGSSMDEPRDGHVPARRWQPATWAEDHECRLRVLRLLDRALADSVESVKQKAIETLLQAASGLISIGLGDEVVERLEHLRVESDQQRRAVWDAISRLLRFDAARLNEDQRQRLDALASNLYGASFHDRLHRFAGRTTLIDALNGAEASQGIELSLRDLVATLADEAMQQPELLRGELQWLSSRDAENAWFFGHRLGVIDEQRVWFQALFDAAVATGEYLLMSAYLQGAADAGDAEWRESILDAWAQDESLAARIVDATWRGTPNDRDLVRLLSLVDEGWLESRRLAVLLYGGWVRGLSGGSFSGLLQKLLRDERAQSVESALALLVQWMDAHDKSLTRELEDVAWQLLERLAGESTPMLSYYWEQIGRTLLSSNLARVVDVLLIGVESGQIPFNDTRMNVLRDALKMDPAKTWEVLGQHLLQSERMAVTLEWWGQETGVLEAQDVNRLITWCQVEPERRPALLARLVKPRAQLSSLVRRLLVEFGPDSDAAHELIANFESGSWAGSIAEHERQQLEIAHRWLKDTEPYVRRWAGQVVQGIEARLPQLQQWEEEQLE